MLVYWCAAWHQGKLWVAFNDGYFANGDVKSRSCIRFIQLDTTTNNRVTQDFDVAASSLYYPALSIYKADNLGIILSLRSIAMTIKMASNIKI
jgi:hypothetical protein